MSMLSGCTLLTLRALVGLMPAYFFRLMPRSLLLGASEMEVVPSCRDVRGVVGILVLRSCEFADVLDLRSMCRGSWMRPLKPEGSLLTVDN